MGSFVSRNLSANMAENNNADYGTLQLDGDADPRCVGYQ